MRERLPELCPHCDNPVFAKEGRGGSRVHKFPCGTRIDHSGIERSSACQLLCLERRLTKTDQNAREAIRLALLIGMDFGVRSAPTEGFRDRLTRAKEQVDTGGYEIETISWATEKLWEEAKFFD